MNLLAIIILNYNSWKDTYQEVQLIKRLFVKENYQIIIVDNQSTNDSYEQLSRLNENKYILLESEKNDGYASGNNIGLRYAKEKGYKFAWILNNDILFEDELLIKKMENVLEQHQDIAIVNPDIYSPDGYLFNRDSIRPNVWDFTFGMIGYKKKGREVKNLGDYGYIYRPQGCCMMVSLDLLNKVDYMDEHTFLYCEELILAERLLKKGYKCALCLEGKVIHNHSKTVKSVLKNRQLNKIKCDSFKYYLKEYRKYSGWKRMLCMMFYRLKNIVLD